MRQQVGAALERLRAGGRTVVGIHLRVGEFIHALTPQGFEFPAPARWYADSLEDIWPRLRNPFYLAATRRYRAPAAPPPPR